MKKKKGFVFIETIVVVSVLLAGLMYLYSAFVSFSNNEKRRVLYDDVSYLYKTYYIKNFLENQRLDRLTNLLDYGNRTDNAQYIIGFDCTSEVFLNKERGLCENLKLSLHISNFYVTFYDLSPLQACANTNEGLCRNFSRYGAEFNLYIKTLGGSGGSDKGYRLIVEYEDNGKGESCPERGRCLHYFSTVRLGDTL